MLVPLTNDALARLYDNEMVAQERASESFARFRLFISMLVIEAARRQYREERRLRDELGFDIVDLGGES